ncbi:hypothetical protein ABK040_010175 [Willaertia magna]
MSMETLEGNELSNFQLLENKLSDDEKLIILSFLNIKTLCSLNCVSKFNFSFSKLCNNDRFWEQYYKKIITDYFYNLELSSVYFDGIDVNKIKTEKENLLNKSENFKENFILFFKNVFKQTKDLQQKRLNTIQYNKNKVLFTKEKLSEENKEIFNDTIVKSMKEHYKYVVVGNGNVGKTCMSMVLTVGRLADFDFIPTVYDNYVIDYEDEPFNNKLIKLSIWDTAGSDSFDRLRPLYYPQTDLFILCFSVANYYKIVDSFDSITKNWMVELKHYNPETPILLCATKIDLRENKKELFKLLKLENPIISKEEGEAKAKEIGAIGYIETSSFNFIGFDNLNKYLTCLAMVGNKKEKKSNKSCLLQ